MEIIIHTSDNRIETSDSIIKLTEKDLKGLVRGVLTRKQFYSYLGGDTIFNVNKEKFNFYIKTIDV